MPSSAKLYHIIHSLSKNEKGFFVKQSKLYGGDKDYLKLFRAFCEMKTFDEAALKALFPGNQRQRLSVTQNYLYRMLLRSLRLYYEKHDVDFQLQNLLAEAKILEAKGFRKEATNVLDKAKKLAEVHHEYLVILEILKRQARFTVANKTKNIVEETLNVYREIKENILFLKEELSYREWSHQMIVYYRKEWQTAPQNYGKAIQGIFRHELMQTAYRPQSFYGQYYQKNIRAVQARMHGKYERALEFSREIVHLWDQYEAIKKANPNLYIIHVSNYLGLAIGLKNVEDFSYYMDKIEHVKVHTMEDTVEQFQNVVFYKLLYYLNYNLLEEAKKLLPETLKGLQLYRNLINPAQLMAMYYNVLVMFFVLEDFGQTLDWIDQILRRQGMEPRKDVRSLAQILEFVVHYELGNDLLLHSLFGATARRLRKEKVKSDFEIIVLQNFRKLLDYSSKTEKLEKLADFKLALEPLEKLKPKPLGLEELLYWLEARLTNRSIREVFAEQL